jgi:hypothetical protein
VNILDIQIYAAMMHKAPPIAKSGILAAVVLNRGYSATSMNNTLTGKAMRAMPDKFRPVGELMTDIAVAVAEIQNRTIAKS